MRLRARWMLAAWLGLASFGVESGAHAQTPPTLEHGAGERAAEEPRGEDVVESYLEQLGLADLRAEMLLDRIETTPVDARGALAERLAKLYVEMLSQATDAGVRTQIEERARRLLELVPEADGAELRINLSKTLYLKAEETLERRRMRLATEEEAKEAEKSLRGLVSQFNDVGVRLNYEIQQLEKAEEQGAEVEEVKAELAEARRLRSLAYYYAGWSHYYIAFSSGSQGAASEAQKAFGWLLNSPGNRAPAVEKVTPALLKYEHIARAALGTGLSAGLRGNDVEALRWLDLVRDAPEAPQAVTDQLLSRRIIVLAGARRWADLERTVRLTRKSDRQGAGPNVTPLDLWNARLLAVVTLDAGASGKNESAELLARIALGDLVARGEVPHVLDLVSQFGTAPIGESGFVVHYVRGVQRYEEARALHRETGGDPDEPTKNAKAINTYNAAAELLESAIEQADAKEFPRDRARASVNLGRARFFAGNMVAAADAFERGFTLAGADEGEEALWLSVVSLDRAVTGQSAGLLGANKATEERRNKLASLFLQTYPASDRAGKLLLMQISAGLITPEEAIRVLSSVEPSAAIYPAARRQLARLLYERMRAQRGTARDVASAKFLTVADEVMTMDRRLVTDGRRPEEQKAAAERLVVTGRQMLDALLGGGAPDPTRARGILETIDAVVRHQSLDASAYGPELVYRRMQIKLLSGDEAGAEADAQALADMGARAGEFLDAADRQIYRRAYTQWKALEGEGSASAQRLEQARRLVQYGQRVLERIEKKPGGVAADAAVIGTYSTVAEAAVEIWRARGEKPMRDLAMRYDEKVLSVQPTAAGSLSRIAETAESAGDIARAVEAWNVRLAAEATGTPGWFEARYNVIRLLKGVDASAALAQIRQLAALYPDYGPQPWAAQLRALENELEGIVPDVPAPTGGVQ